MFWFVILMLCISLESFVLMMEKGATCAALVKRNILLHGCILGAINLLFLYAGWLWIPTFDNRLLSCLLLVMVSLFSLIRTICRKVFIEKLDHPFRFQDSIKHAVFCGINTLCISTSLSYLQLPLPFQLAVVFLLSFLAVVAGWPLGYYQGALYQKRICYISAFTCLLVAFLQAGSVL